jgi:hypothetical protein
MVPLTDLWLAILLSGVAVFLVSSGLHMIVPIHAKDHEKLPAEEGLLEAMRKGGLKPGNYMFPCPASMKDMATPEMQEKYAQGPVGFMMIFPNGMPAIGKSLVQWLVLSLVVSTFVAYSTGLGHGAGAEGMVVFRHAAVVAFGIYGISSLVDPIWKGVKWSTGFKFVFDGLLYGLATGGVFAWLWPAAA